MDVMLLNRFQSTRPHGARPLVNVRADVIEGFNPRARTGRDGSVMDFWISEPGFNPRARTGRDRDTGAVSAFSIAFQSTRPHGARPTGFSDMRGMGRFNPRARTGRDQVGRLHASAPFDVSIHAPARGATS